MCVLVKRMRAFMRFAYIYMQAKKCECTKCKETKGEGDMTTGRENICKSCCSKRSLLSTMFGKWPIPSFSLMPVEFQTKMWQADAKTKPTLQTAVVMALSLHHEEVEKELLEGTFLPLNVWATRGYNMEQLANIEKNCMNKWNEETECLDYKVNVESIIKSKVRKEVTSLVMGERENSLRGKMSHYASPMGKKLKKRKNRKTKSSSSGSSSSSRNSSSSSEEEKELTEKQKIARATKEATDKAKAAAAKAKAAAKERADTKKLQKERVAKEKAELKKQKTEEAKHEKIEKKRQAEEEKESKKQQAAEEKEAKAVEMKDQKHINTLINVRWLPRMYNNVQSNTNKMSRT